ncbi:MAG: orotate phosphoribosyltransferase [Terriglobales bacterium]
MSTVPRQQLLTLLAEKSFRLGDFTLSSGGRSDYYIDCRATTLDAEGARLTARVVLDELYRRGWVAQGIGGMTLGADPIVVAVAMLTAQQVKSRRPERSASDAPQAWMIHGFLVRKGEKGHGTGQRIEGFREKGSRVVIVDDVCTTGASTIQAIEAARQAGMEVIGVLCLVEREDAGGRLNVEKAAAPAPFVAVYTAAEIRKEHLRLQHVAQAPPVKTME